MKSLVILTGFLIAVSASAAERYVAPSGSPLWPYTNWASAATNIQDAVNAATNGETVWVTNGTYYCGSNSASPATPDGQIVTSMVTVTEAITIQSMNGPEVTIVDANYPAFTNRCFFLSGGATVSGFTITNGHPNDIAGGGGVVIATSGRLTNCWITGNMATNGYSAYWIGGGGVWCDRGGEVLNCRIYANIVTTAPYATLAASGGLHAYGTVSSPQLVIRNSVISNNCVYYNNNIAGGYAISFPNAAFTNIIISNCTVINNMCGGINIPCPGTIENCRIIGNRILAPVGAAAGLRVTGGGIVRDSWIINNSAWTEAGGVYISGGGMLSNCVVAFNTNEDIAGGVYMVANTTLVQNCMIVSNYANWAGVRGGGVYMNGGILRNCLISSNSIKSSGYGGGVAMLNGAGVTSRVENCTVVANKGDNCGGIYNAGGAGSAILINTICYSNLPANTLSWYSSSNLVAYNCSITNEPPGSGNITNAPDFVDYAGFNFRLNPGSPCINAGTNQDWMSGAVDLDGHSRISRYYGNLVDIGAYEHLPALTIYVAY